MLQTALDDRARTHPDLAAIHSRDIVEGLPGFPGATSKEVPYLVAFRTRANTVDIAMLNGPAVGLPFVIAQGVASGAMGRFEGYFDAVWNIRAAVPNRATVLPPSFLVRHAIPASRPDRDQLGICLIEVLAPLHVHMRRSSLRSVVDVWPDAKVSRLLLSPPNRGAGPGGPQFGRA